MSLPPGSRLGPYEIVSPLGAGGMGEVYRAHDPRLGRNVAIKILPAAFSEDQERLWRFEREAKAVASLNHPHICTIHDIGDHDGHRYLVMELMDGQPLNDRLTGGPLPNPLLIELAIHIADALDAAHRAGVIHRDLKPANIFVTKRGEAKLLDFGLAKVEDDNLAAGDGATKQIGAGPSGDLATMASPGGKTTVGTLLGTASYMSPEQARGEAVDARSDLFSFGAVLYEMATGRTPFSGKTLPLLFDAILNKDPQPATALNPQLPVEILPIIDKALEKDPDLRYQNAADLRADLKRLRRDAAPRQRQIESMGAGSGPSGSMDATLLTGAPPPAQPVSVAIPPTTSLPTSVATPPAPAKSSRVPYIVAASLAVVVALSGFSVWMWLRGSSSETAPATAGASLDAMQVQQITSTGNATLPAISPDGKYIVYLIQDQEGISVWLRQTGATNSVKILPAESGMIGLGATVGPGSTFVDVFRGLAIWRVPFLGGAPKKLIDRATTPVGWSHDGQRMAYLRPAKSGRGEDLVVTNAEGGDERIVTTAAGFAMGGLPGQLPTAAAWSPDDRSIATFRRLGENFLDMGVTVFDVASGESTVVNIRGDVPLGLGWFDSKTLLVAQALESGTPSQIWRVSFPDGRRTRLTNDISRYTTLSLTADANSLVTYKPDTRVSLWVGDAKGENGRDWVGLAPFQSAAVQYATVAWDGPRVLFTHTLNGRYEIFRRGPDDSGPQAIVAGRELSALPDGSVVYRSVADEVGLWKANRDGGQATELVRGTVTYPYVTPDGSEVIFSWRGPNNGTQTLWRVATTGGAAMPILTEAVGIYGFSDVSPDGKSIVITLAGKWVICDFPACATRRAIGPTGGGRQPRWTPDGKAFAYIPPSNDNLWVQPLDGSAAKQLTHFTERAIGHFAWSRDGKQLAISRVTGTSDIVLFRGLKGKPTP